MIGGFFFLSIIVLLGLLSNVQCETLATVFDGPNGDRFSDGDKVNRKLLIVLLSCFAIH